MFALARRCRNEVIIINRSFRSTRCALTAGFQAKEYLTTVGCRAGRRERAFASNDYGRSAFSCGHFGVGGRSAKGKSPDDGFWD